MYDWVFSLSENEKPTDVVIDDDEAFDAWLASYVAKQKADQRSIGSSSGAPAKRASSHQNQIQF
jgi:hypothetical protein